LWVEVEDVLRFVAGLLLVWQGQWLPVTQDVLLLVGCVSFHMFSTSVTGRR